jgi:hypothetical protein
VTHDEENRLAIRFFAYVCAAIGGQDPELCEQLMAEVRDGPNRLIQLAAPDDPDHLFIFEVAVDDLGTQLCAFLRDPKGKVAPLVACNAVNLGVSDETIAEWGQRAADHGNVYVTVPDAPPDLQDPNDEQEGNE